VNSPHAALFKNPDFIADLDNAELSARNVAQRWSVGKTFITKHRQRRAQGLAPSSRQPADRVGQNYQERDSSGAFAFQEVRERPITLDDAREWIRSSGDDPDGYHISIRSTAYGHDMFSNRMSATPKKTAESAATVPKADLEHIKRSVLAGFTVKPTPREHLVDVAVLQPTDEQWGKTDFNGGSEQTVERVMSSYRAFVEYAKEYRPREIVLAHTGDGIENACSTNSQRDTNDLDVPHQILALYSMELSALRMISPLAERVIAGYVPSNHGRWRTAIKADAGDPHADFGIAVAKMLQETQQQMSAFPNVDIQIPGHLMESMTIRTSSGLGLGLVHGHQASGADKMGDWWSKQDHGRMPTWEADALFVGHWHSYRAYESGDGRPVFVGPASDNGSSWFSNIKGVRSTAGMLAVCFEGKKWKYQEIL
jgi:hypothetical protein